MDEDEFDALQERVVKVITGIEDGEPLQSSQVVRELKTLLMLATRFRKGLEEASYEGNWSNDPRNRQKDGIWVGLGFGGELAREAMEGRGMTYAHLSDYDEYFKRR